MSSEHEAAVEIAVLRAAEFFEDAIRRGRPLEASRKDDHSLVLNLDLESQEIIRTHLPHLPIVAEEDISSHTLIGAHEEFFLIDPLDGTSSCRRFFGVRGGQVGFGPLVGYVKGGSLVATSYYNVPTKTLVSARAGRGAREIVLQGTDPEIPSFHARNPLRGAPEGIALSECGLLFFAGKHGEAHVAQRLRSEGRIDNVYRFGGFASDVMRVAQGHEQVQLQYSVKAWDFSAVLMALEAGYGVIMDPAGKRRSFQDWKIQHENPVLIAPTHLLAELLEVVQASSGV